MIRPGQAHGIQLVVATVVSVAAPAIVCPSAAATPPAPQGPTLCQQYRYNTNPGSFVAGNGTTTKCTLAGFTA